MNVQTFEFAIVYVLDCNDLHVSERRNLDASEKAFKHNYDTGIQHKGAFAITKVKNHVRNHSRIYYTACKF